MTNYADYTDVYEQSGFTEEMLIRYTGEDASGVQTLLTKYCASATKKIKDLLEIPHLVPRELHLGTGEDDEFQLGPEDECVYFDEEVEDLIESVKHCYFKRTRMKKPYPRDCDEATEDKDLWDATGYTQPSDETTIVKAGTNSMKFDWSGGAGKARYPDVSNDKYIQYNIDIYEFVFFRVQSDTNDVTVTLRLYNSDGSCNTATYLVSKKGKWYKVMLDIDDDFSGSVNWDDDELYYFEIEVDKACTLYVDNFNFNDEWCFTAPKGTLVIMHKSTDEPPCDGFPFYTTYTYDPFKESVPKTIEEACAQMASVELIDHLIGIREGAIAFEFEGSTLITNIDKETLYARKGSLTARAKENLRSYGYGWSGTVARPYY